MEIPIEKIEKDVSAIEDICKQVRIYLEVLKRTNDPENVKEIILKISLEMIWIKNISKGF